MEANALKTGCMEWMRSLIMWEGKRAPILEHL